MTVGWNRILGISVPILLAMLAFWASMIPVILQRKERKRVEKKMPPACSKVGTECPQDDVRFGFSIVGSINSNNNSPYLAETLSKMLDHASELGIELNLDLRGCATIG